MCKLVKIIKMHILVKVIDTYKSTKHKNKTLSEYIVYLVFGETIIEARTAIGEQQKDLSVLEFVEKCTGDIINVKEIN